jgi:hypothetical protein
MYYITRCYVCEQLNWKRITILFWKGGQVNWKTGERCIQPILKGPTPTERKTGQVPWKFWGQWRRHIIFVCVRSFFARSAPPDWWRWDAEEGHGDPSLTCTFLVSTPAGAAILGLWECTFRGFLVIVSSCRFRWAQAPPSLINLDC